MHEFSHVFAKTSKNFVLGIRIHPTSRIAIACHTDIEMPGHIHRLKAKAMAWKIRILRAPAPTHGIAELRTVRVPYVGLQIVRCAQVIQSSSESVSWLTMAAQPLMFQQAMPHHLRKSIGEVELPYEYTVLFDDGQSR